MYPCLFPSERAVLRRAENSAIVAVRQTCVGDCIARGNRKQTLVWFDPLQGLELSERWAESRIINARVVRVIGKPGEYHRTGDASNGCQERTGSNGTDS